MATNTQVVQQGNTFKVGSQSFSSRAAADKAAKRISTSMIQTGKTKLPTISESIKVASQNGMSSGDIAKAANTAVNKAGGLAQNQTEEAQKKVQSLKNIGTIYENQTGVGEGGAAIDTAQDEDTLEGATPLNDNVTGDVQEIDPNTGLPIQSGTAATGSQVAGGNAAGSGGSVGGVNQGGQGASGSAGGQSNAGSSALGGGQVAGGGAVMAANDSSIGTTIPNSNAPIENQAASNAQGAAMDQSNVNAIKDNPNLGLANSPDSDFWNKFGLPAVDQEGQLPGYMNERNKVIASSLMLKNPNMKSMSDAARKNLIIQDMVQRQGAAIDPTIIDWYNTTADNVNNLITRQIPPYTSNDFFSMMLKGQDISDAMAENQTNPSYVSAKRRYDNLQQFSSMNTSQMTDAIRSGSLVKGTVIRNDLLNKGMGQIMNDAYASYTTNMGGNIFNKVLSDVLGFDPDVSLAMQASGEFDIGTGLETALSIKILQTMKEDQLPTLGTFLAADPEVEQAKTKSRETEKELNDLADQINSFSDDIKTKVVERGGEATGDPFLESYITEKTKPFVKKRETLNNQYRNEIAKLDNASENAKLAFEIKEYNKNLEIEGYKFVLDSLYKQNESKAAQEKAAYDQSIDDRDFAYKVAKDERDYQLDLAKFKVSASKGGGGGGSSINVDSILKGIYNGTLGATGVLNSKVLEKLGLDSLPRKDQINAYTNALLSTYVNKDSSYEEIDTIIGSLGKTFGKELDTNSVLTYLNKTTSPTKALNTFLQSNNFAELAKDEKYDSLASGILAATAGRDVNEDKLKTVLMEKLGDRKTVNGVLDQIGVKKVSRRQDITKY